VVDPLEVAELLIGCGARGVHEGQGSAAAAPAGQLGEIRIQSDQELVQLTHSLSGPTLIDANDIDAPIARDVQSFHRVNRIGKTRKQYSQGPSDRSPGVSRPVFHVFFPGSGLCGPGGWFGYPG